MYMTKKNLTILVVAVLLLATGTGYAIWNTNNKANTNSDTNSDTPTFIAGTPINDDGSDEMTVSAIIAPGIEIIKTKTGTSTAVTKNYSDALSIYAKSGYRFQFSNCSGNPGALTMKIGTKFMIDNRDNESHLISIGTKTYKLAAYDFAIVSIQKVGKFNITCDGGGAANVSVQK